MLSPLAKRFPRELKSNLGKYLGIFFMMVMAIGDSACRVYLGHRVQPLADCFPAGELARRGLTVRIAASQDVARFHNK